MLISLALLSGIVAGSRAFTAPAAVSWAASLGGLDLALCGATLGASGGFWIGGLVAGVIGAAIGTYSGAEARARLAKAFGRDPPAALIEDAAAIVLGLVIVLALR